MNIQELKAQEAKLRMQLAENIGAQREIITAEFLKKHNLAFGQEVRANKWGKEIVGIFDSIRFFEWSSNINQLLVRQYTSVGEPARKPTPVEINHLVK